MEISMVLSGTKKEVTNYFSLLLIERPTGLGKSLTIILFLSELTLLYSDHSEIKSLRRFVPFGTHATDKYYTRNIR